MIRRYVYGNVIETEAVLNKPEQENGTLPYFTVDEQAMTLSYTMEEKDQIYGLGENVRGINKRGWYYESKCSDESDHKEDRHSLYGAHNFLVADGKETFGIFVDYPGIIRFDVGYTRSEELVITASDWNLDVYIITGEDIKDIVKQFRHLVGRSYIAPKWAFGYGQSRWSYMSADEVREVVKKHRELKIPLDSVYLDIDYMERYKDFTLNNETFPDFAAFNEEMKKEHIHLVPIIDAGVKQEEGYDVYEEGLEKGYFCKKEDGSPFVAAVWPGKALFPDMLNKEAREWFGNKYRFLLDQGVEGFWNDMNEPAIFYTEDRLKDVLEELDRFKGQNLDMDKYYEFNGLVHSLSNNTEDYKVFYHNMNGEKIRHDRVHNLFGYNMTRAAGEAFDKVARAIGLGYPGGPKIDKVAKQGNPEAIHFPRAKVAQAEYDFSFSGLKSAVLNYLNSCEMKGETVDQADVAASFQKAVVDVLVDHSMEALRKCGYKKFAIAGGVASNSALRAAFEEACTKENIEFYHPSPIYCTDNAAMIGAAGYYEFLKGVRSGYDLNAVPGLRLGER